jgi:hypothetical protein
MRVSKADREQALATLREHFKPGQTVYTILRHVSASGDWAVARVLGESLDQRREGIKVSGAGMDMGFHIVYTLGRYLWPDGTPEPHGTRNGQPDSDGGYALKHRWL